MKNVRVAISCTLLAMSLASASYAAAPARLSEAEARHLLVRTGFAPSQNEVDALTGQPGATAVSALIAAAQASKPQHPPPDFVSQPPPVPYRLLASKDE